MNENNEEDVVLGNSVSFIGQHWAAIASLAYLYLIFIGMLLAYFEFIPWGINAFDYSNLEDFILGVFKDIKVISAALFLAIYLLIVLFWMEPQFSTRQDWKSYSILITTLVLLVPIAFVVIPNIFRDISTAKKEILKDDNRITINLRHDKITDFTTNQTGEEYFLIGTQGSFVFIVSSKDKDVGKISDPIIIPVTNISGMKLYQPEKLSKTQKN